MTSRLHGAHFATSKLSSLSLSVTMCPSNMVYSGSPSCDSKRVVTNKFQFHRSSLSAKATGDLVFLCRIAIQNFYHLAI